MKKGETMHMHCPCKVCQFSSKSYKALGKPVEKCSEVDKLRSL